MPADLRLAESGNLQTLEALLTGESVPIDKNTTTINKSNVPVGDRKNTAFMASNVVRGRAKGVVIACDLILKPWSTKRAPYLRSGRV